ncbi:hypothetical protein BGZ67_007375 [Mortierella alpina]|nr:hypothetical protein BGZ67_007375 [Mortierella alpina]
MAGNGPMIVNHVSVDINDEPVSHDLSPLLIEKLEPNSLEVGRPMLSTSSDISSTSGSEIKAEAAVLIVPKAPIVHKWYFKTTSTTSANSDSRNQSKVQLDQLQEQGTTLKKQNGDLTKLNYDLTDRLREMQVSLDTQTKALMAFMDDMRQRPPSSS